MDGHLRRRPGWRPVAAGGARLPPPHRHSHLHAASRPGGGSLEGVDDLQQGVLFFTRAIARAEGIRTISQLPSLIEEFGVRSVVFGARSSPCWPWSSPGPVLPDLHGGPGPGAGILRDSPPAHARASTWQTIGIHTTQSAVRVRRVAGGAVRGAGHGRPQRPDPADVHPHRRRGAVGVPGASVLPFVLGGGVLTFIAMGLAIVPLARRGCSSAGTGVPAGPAGSGSATTWTSSWWCWRRWCCTNCASGAWSIPPARRMSASTTSGASSMSGTSATTSRPATA